MEEEHLHRLSGGASCLKCQPRGVVVGVIGHSLWTTIEHKSNEVMLWMNPHYCIELMHPAYHNLINLTKKVNEAWELLQEGSDGNTSCSLKLIPTKYPLVC